MCIRDRYLPLAAVVAVTVLGSFALFGRTSLLVFAAAAAGLGVASFGRNRAYASELGIWSDTVAKAPGNARARGDLGFFTAFRLSKDPPSFMTLFEDSVALLGILIAAAATFAAVALGCPELDGAGSIAIGLILAATSVFLVRESKSLLMGEGAHPSIRNSILSIANAQPSCLSANGLITVQLGPDQVMAMLSLEFSDAMLAPQIEEAVISLEQKMREENPEIVALFVKPQTAKTYHDQRERSLGQVPPQQTPSVPPDQAGGV